MEVVDDGSEVQQQIQEEFEFVQSNSSKNTKELHRSREDHLTMVDNELHGMQIDNAFTTLGAGFAAQIPNSQRDPMEGLSDMNSNRRHQIPEGSSYPLSHEADIDIIAEQDVMLDTHESRMRQLQMKYAQEEQKHTSSREGHEPPIFSANQFHPRMEYQTLQHDRSDSRQTSDFSKVQVSNKKNQNYMTMG